MNTSFQNAINNGSVYHVKVFNSGSPEVIGCHYGFIVHAYSQKISIDNSDGSYIEIDYDDIIRLEINACQFPYKENTPFLYIYLK